MRPDRDLLDAFLEEGRELVERAAVDLAVLSRHPDARDALDGLFRGLHTLKGSTALFDLPALTALLHAAETLLERVRAGGAMDAAEAADVTTVLDTTAAWLDAIRAETEPGEALLATTAALTVRLQGEAAAPPASGAAPDPSSGWALALGRRHGTADAVVAVRYRPDPEAYFRGDDPAAIVRALPELRALEVEVLPAAGPGSPYDPFRCRLEFRALCAAQLPEVRAALRLVADQIELAALPARAAETRPAQAAPQTVRVSADRLDDVAALVDELVIAKNALDYAVGLVAGAGGQDDELRELARKQAALGRTLTDLHGAVTDLRLVSLRHLFSRFPRLVRDAAARLGKAVAFESAGEDVALDKSVVDALFEPLLHLLRNAIDHGVEDATGRAAAGKPAAAQVRLAARASGEAVVIEVSDDGRGLDPAAIRALAVRRGAVDQAAADQLNDTEAAELIFAPGFSTARTVSEFSGRGVGMDSVRETVTGLGGQVDLQNRPGAGLTVRLTLPARTVLARVLVVAVGEERFAVPLDGVRETHRVRAEETTPIRQGRAYVRRDEIIPILRLRTLLGLAPAADPPAFPVLSLAGLGEPLGVQVDALGERLEAPMRPLSGLLNAFPGLQGSILQGDGQVLLVLDLAELTA